MIKIIKPKEVPLVLNDKKAQQEFDKNIEAKKFVGQEIYKKVKTDLEKIYNKKCAYCESNICAVSYSHIEHYRPKNEYYWLVYSWDNLLLACQICNTNKGEKFETNETKIIYKKQFLNDLHDKAYDFNEIEKPQLINPELEEDLDNHFTFNLKAEIIAKSERMKYTIEVCELNRADLVAARIEIWNELKFINTLTSSKIEAKQKIISLLKRKLDNNYEFIAWKKFLLKTILNLNLT